MTSDNDHYDHLDFIDIDKIYFKAPSNDLLDYSSGCFSTEKASKPFLSCDGSKLVFYRSI